MKKRLVTLMLMVALAVVLAFPSVALAHGEDQSFAAEWAEHGVASTALIVGGFVVFGGVAFVLSRRR